MGYIPEMRSLSDIFEEYNKHTDVAKVNLQELNKAMGELFSGNAKPLYDLLENITLDADAFEETAKKYGYTVEQLDEQLENLKFSLKEDAESVEALKKSLGTLDGATAKTATGIKKLGSVMKSVFATVGWTLLITALVTAALKL